MNTMSAAEFTALADAIGTEAEVAEAMETERSTVNRWKSGARPVPGPARVLARILAAQATAEREAERREVLRTTAERRKKAAGK